MQLCGGDCQNGPGRRDSTGLLLSLAQHLRPSPPPTNNPAHTHIREEVILLDGGLYDRSLDQWFGPGYYACRPPGMVHGPYDACPERVSGRRWRWLTRHQGARQFINIRYDPGYEVSVGVGV